MIFIRSLPLFSYQTHTFLSKNATLDNIVNMVETKFRVKRGVAIGITVFLANVVGTISLMCAGISIASIAAGVPIFVKK